MMQKGIFLLLLMKQSKFLLIISILCIPVLVGIFCTNKRPHDGAAKQAQENFNYNILQLKSIINHKLLKAIEQKSEPNIKKSFAKARLQYKTVEYYVNYFFPSTALMLNGPPIDEIELGENLIEHPAGFQVMEALIYDAPTADNQAELLNEAKKMTLNLDRVLRFNAQYILTDAQLFDAARLELFSIIGLGITGFDTPDALQSLPEAAAAIGGLKTLISLYGAPKQTFNQAIQYLNQHPDFNQFDRLTFITDYLQPIGNDINNLRKRLDIPTATSGSALQDSTYNLFLPKAFNVDRLVGNHTEFINADKVMLGKLLFNDKRLSKQNQRSCASCHHQNKAFTDGLIKAEGLHRGEQLARNTPTLTYAGLQRGFFYDLKAGTLEDQALNVVQHKQEMAGSVENAAKIFNANKSYRKYFQKAFSDTSGLATPWKIQHALATYIRSLALFNSRFDAYMQGDHTQLQTEEKLGFNLFMGKAKCGSCHFAPLFNGTAPPLFAKTEAEVLGVPAKADTANAKIDPDLGRYALYQYEQYKYAFKTPTLRNIAKTAPYMHNGVYKNLNQVIDFYNRGGGAGIGIHLKNQTLADQPLKLSKSEIKAIEAFLKTLSDR